MHSHCSETCMITTEHTRLPFRSALNTPRIQQTRTVRPNMMSNLLAILLMLPSAILVNATPIIPRMTLATTAGANPSLVPQFTARDRPNDPESSYQGSYRSVNDSDDNHILNSAFQRPPHHNSDQWALLAAKIIASISALVAIFIIIFFLHRRRVRGRRRRIGEMMGLGIKRNEILLHKASRHYRAASGNSESTAQSHPRQYAHRWRFSVIGWSTTSGQ
jgi:hypothetical protein